MNRSNSSAFSTQLEVVSEVTSLSFSSENTEAGDSLPKLECGLGHVVVVVEVIASLSTAGRDLHVSASDF
jgi:hypothetical protein